MKLIEDIRNRGYKGFDRLPHYDLTEIYHTSKSFFDSISNAYARPIHDEMALEFSVGEGDSRLELVATYTKVEGEKSQAFLDMYSKHGPTVYTSLYVAELFTKHSKWGIIAATFHHAFDSLWVPACFLNIPDNTQLDAIHRAAMSCYSFISTMRTSSDYQYEQLSLKVSNCLNVLFALCHTQGVETVTHTPTPKQVRGFRRKNRKIPRSFKTLKLPTALQEAVSESEETGNKLDQPHFRRGHLKTAKSPRYKVKNWWTESHIVGKDAPGKLITDTKVVH